MIPASDPPPEVPKTLFSGRFRVLGLLGRGGFGEVYRGVQESTGEAVAIKVERVVSRASFLFHEARVMMLLKERGGDVEDPGYAQFRYFGQEGNYRMLIMDLLGPSLEDIHEKRRRFSLKTTLMVGIQVVSRLEYIHLVGVAHRDLKPDNFVLGRGAKKNRIYLIDFGLSARCIGSDGRHRDEQSGRPLVGTARYASARTHEGFSQSRRDDIEQLVYVMIYLYRGRLPWSGLAITGRDEKERKIGQLKREFPLEDICRGCPRSFVLLLNYARKMKFDEEPAYEMIRGLLKKELSEQHECNDNVFDWDLPDAETPVFSPAVGDGRDVAGAKESDGGGAASPGAHPEAGIQSDADGKGILSGPQSQDITSLGCAE